MFFFLSDDNQNEALGQQGRPRVRAKGRGVSKSISLVSYFVKINLNEFLICLQVQTEVIAIVDLRHIHQETETNPLLMPGIQVICCYHHCCFSFRVRFP